MKKTILKTLALCSLTAASLFSEETITGVSVVDYGQCISESRYGIAEQKAVDKIRTQLSTLITDTDKEIQELNTKFEDTTFLDSLSPKAEEELRARHQTLMEDRQRYQWQFGQIMQQASYQLMHKISAQIARASEKLALEKDIDYVINKEACFYYRPALDLTQAVIAEMDKNFETDSSMQKVSENDSGEPSFDRSAE